MLLNQFFITQASLLDSYSSSFKRYLYHNINWDDRLIGIIGARGVGKTTLLLQHIKEKYKESQKCLYIVGDDINVLRIGIREIAQEFEVRGGEVLIIDEVHKYPNWSQEVKNIYDLQPNIKIIISGSSNINIIREKYDLSRRIVSYKLSGLSFREYINLELEENFDVLSLDDILHNSYKTSRKIVTKLKLSKKRVLSLFENYLKHGYYPYYKEGLAGFNSRLTNVLDKVLHEDIPSVHKISQNTISSMKKLISLIASSHPFVVDITSISRNLGISRTLVYELITYLLEAEILIEGKPSGSGSRSVRKPSKLFLNNTNLYFVLENQYGWSSKIGTIRETFVFNQLSQKSTVAVPKQGDILVEDKYTFEIGGKNKGFNQLQGVSNGFIFADGIEYGFDKKIPLWMLGFLY